MTIVLDPPQSRAILPVCCFHACLERGESFSFRFAISTLCAQSIFMSSSVYGRSVKTFGSSFLMKAIMSFTSLTSGTWYNLKFFFWSGAEGTHIFPHVSLHAVVGSQWLAAVVSYIVVMHFSASTTLFSSSVSSACE